MRRLILGFFCVFLSGAVFAVGPDSVRKRVQETMLVTGLIQVAPGGSVVHYTLDHPDALPPEVRLLIGRVIPAWKFAPFMVDGKAVLQDAKMALRVVAKPLGDDNYRITVTGTWFGDDTSGQDHVSQETISYKRRVQPIYPRAALDGRVSGTVYVLLKVGRDGKVADAVATQVNLRVIASDSELASWRKVLADAALHALKQDTFNPPTAGSAVDQPYWLVNIPVGFRLAGRWAPAASQEADYGQWQPYVPGPVQESPWTNLSELPGSADAVPEGGVLPVKTSLHLLTPVGDQ
jgi:hypothetical protein